MIDKEFVQFFKDMGFGRLERYKYTQELYKDIRELNEEEIKKLKNSYVYQKWLMNNAIEDFKKAIRETKLITTMMSAAESLNKYMDKIFKKEK